jgi:hypothetical protein
LSAKEFAAADSDKDGTLHAIAVGPEGDKVFRMNAQTARSAVDGLPKRLGHRLCIENQPRAGTFASAIRRGAD